MGDKEDEGQQFVKESKEFQTNMRETMVEMVQLLSWLNQQLSAGRTMPNGVEGSSSGVVKLAASTKKFRAKLLEKGAENETEAPPDQEDEIARLHNKYHALSVPYAKI